jgi:uncharacterized membrane protein YeaQ/YmgE (transglycosylase-associated protein family)
VDVLALVIGAIIAGVVIGPLARLVMPGSQDLSFGITILLGGIGALVGGIVYALFGGEETSGIDWVLHAVQVAVAILAIVVYSNVMKGRAAT